MPGGSGGSTETPVWREESSEVRLRAVAPFRREHTVRIDLPLELRNQIERVTAFAVDGTGLPVRKVVLDGTVAALEVALPEATSGDHRLVVYFPADEEEDSLDAEPEDEDREGLGHREPDEFQNTVSPAETAESPESEPAVKAEAAEAQERGPDSEEEEAEAPRELQIRPVSLYFEARNLVARPFHFDQALAFDSNRRGLPLAGGLVSFTESVSARRRRSQELTVYRYRKESMIAAAAAKRVRFGVDSRDTAWFFYLDQQPVFSWKDYADEDQGLLLSDWVDIRPGLSLLSLQVWQRANEESPGLYWLVDTGKRDSEMGFEPLAEAELHAAEAVAALTLEFRDNDLAGGFALRPEKRYVIAESGRELQVWQAGPVGEGGPVSLRLDGRDITTAGSLILPQPPSHLTMRFPEPAGGGSGAEFTFSLPAAWLEPQLVAADLVLTTVPRLWQTGRKVEIGGRFGNLPGSLTGIAGTDFALVWSLRQGGVPIAEGTVELAPAVAGEFVFQLPLTTPVAGELAVSLRLAGEPLGEACVVRLIDPSLTPAKIEADGHNLSADGQPAVLVVRDPADGFTAPFTDKVRQVVLIDDFWAVRLGPGADLCPVEVLARETGLPFRHLHTGTRFDGNRDYPGLLKLSLLPAALEDPGEVLIWAVGAPFLRHHRDPEELPGYLHFVIKATLARGKLPIAVTIPPLADLEPETVRRTAIAIKRIGLEYGIPVIDLYSRAIVQFGDYDQAAAALFEVDNDRVGLLHPNNRGRLWLARTVVEQVKVLIDEK